MKNKIYRYNPKYNKLANYLIKNDTLLKSHQGLVIVDIDVICTKFKKF